MGHYRHGEKAQPGDWSSGTVYGEVTHWAEVGKPTPPGEIELRDLEWYEDEHGSYWRAKSFVNGREAGIVGSYYSVGGDGRRKSKGEQEKEIAGWRDRSA